MEESCDQPARLVDLRIVEGRIGCLRHHVRRESARIAREGRCRYWQRGQIADFGQVQPEFDYVLTVMSDFPYRGLDRTLEVEL
jgi:hypothetical protein